MTPKRVLNVIDKLCIVWENGPKTKKQAQKIIDEIYRYSHLFSNCKNLHVDWRKEFLKTEKELKDY